MFATRRKPQPNRKPGFLQRLARNVAGTTAALMAASLIPLAAFAGAAVDTARLYVVKVRLQQACDAGALAGRKFMTGTTLDSNATTQANAFFTNNFRAGWFTTSGVSFTPTLTEDGQVRASARATVPMTLMTMFGNGSVTLNATCQARLDIPDVDIMFVLDTTGSMACAASDSQSTCGYYVVSNTSQSGGVWSVAEKSNSRIKALRSAVLTFYDTLEGAADPSTHIRYGVVPYSSTVNVGYLLRNLNTSYLVSDNWNYQSRKWVGDANGSSSNDTVSASNSSTCDSYERPRTPAVGYPATVVTTSWNSSRSRCTRTTTQKIPNFTYNQYTWDISNYVTGAATPNPAAEQQRVGVTGPTDTWAGCIEERDTSALSSFSTPLPYDLDVDLVPSSRATRWRPMWPEVIYDRNGTPETTSATRVAPINNNAYYYNLMACPKQAQRLEVLTRDDLDDYVTAADFKPMGHTYHDIGMIWGVRMLSPTGIFKGDTDCWPNRPCPQRYIVFMTDGQMEPDPSVYGAYGFEKFDRRVTGGSTSQQTNYHNARLAVACDAAKARNITVFVVAYAQTLTSQLSACASPGKAFEATDDAQLASAFRTIASQIADLRLSQ